jgi:DNA phosphorothioation-associated putative methyltransferase
LLITQVFEQSRVSAPKVQLADKRFEDYKELLTPLMAFFTKRGRLPTLQELPETEAFSTEFGNLRRTFQIVLQATNPQQWNEISDRRRQDLLVYLALSHFGRRPKLRDLIPVVQNDIKSLFGGYQQACAAADLMLMSLGNLEVVEKRCKSSAIGQKRPNSLWVYVPVIESLTRCYGFTKVAPLARSVVLKKPMLSSSTSVSPRFPICSTQILTPFDTDPHPASHTSMEIDLRDLHVHYQDYDPQ